MSEATAPRYLSDLEAWRKLAASDLQVENVDDLPVHSQAPVKLLESAYQDRFLAWFPMLQREAGRRPALIEKLLNLGTSGRVSCVEEFELALGFTVYNAEGHSDGDTEDRLDRLDALFSENDIPWDGLDQFFVVFDDANPLYDRELVRRRAPLIHLIAAKMPNEFSSADLRTAGAAPERIGDALQALETVEMVERVATVPDERWRKTELFAASEPVSSDETAHSGDKGSMIAADAVLGSGKELRHFLKQHEISKVRDVVLVTAAWFRLKGKRTFTRSDIEHAAERAGRETNGTSIGIELSRAFTDDLLRRVAHGLYEIRDAGSRYTQRILRDRRSAMTKSGKAQSTPDRRRR